MNKGAYWAGSPLPSDDVARPEPIGAAAGINLDRLMSEEDVTPEPLPADGRERIILGLLAFAAVGWIAVTVQQAISSATAGSLGLSDIVKGVSVASGPLILIVAILILWQRNGNREAQRYADVARTVRTETLALDAVLGIASHRLAEDRQAVAEQADRLTALADRTSAQLQSVADNLARGIAELARQSQDLDAAAGTARVDMGVLLADLPRAQAEAQTLSESIRAVGIGAHEQAAALDTTLMALANRARDAEENAGGAANRLSAQLSHLTNASSVTADGIDQAGRRMTVAVDGVLERAAEAVERTRNGVAAQSEAIESMIERGRAATEAATTEAARAVEERITALHAELERLAAQLATQDGIGSAMLERIQRGLSLVEARFAELDETGRARTEKLGEALGTLGGHAERTMAALNNGGTAATTLINRAETLRGAIALCLEELGQSLPAALSRLEEQAARSREAIDNAGPGVDKLQAAASEAAQALDTARIALDERRAAIDSLADAIETRLASAKESAGSLGEAVSDVDNKATQLADSTSPKLVEALIRVRETAGQAAQRAQDALGAIVPSSALALGEAGRAALERAISEEVESQIARVAAASEQAVESARAAGARLEEQLGRIATTSASVESAIAEGKAEVESSDRDNFSRRVALLVDSLNSTAIDVTKLLSNEASDTSWAAYLRGDRGVFTRRAVKLIESGEAREITRHYEEEAEFRDQVNRYIHDFETLLRPILATRDGSTLAVILLSSDMGKLYVALAQAIERLRS